MKVTAKQVHTVLQTTKVKQAIADFYRHLTAPFTIDEIQDFIDGKPGEIINDRGFTRSFQVQQAIGAIGAGLVDRNLADQATVDVYKALWELKGTKTCKYCTKSFKFSLMMGSEDHCLQSRCQMAAMRDWV